MAQKQLSPVLQTRKINSLPQDLRKIADELLFEKFGADDTVKEMKVAKSTASFREISEGIYGFNGTEDVAFYDGDAIIPSVRDFFIDPRARETSLSTRVDVVNRQRVTTTPVITPDFRGFTEALRRLDEQNLPSRDRVFRVTPGFWNKSRMDREISLYTNYSSRVETIFGCRVIVDPTSSNEIEVRF